MRVKSGEPKTLSVYLDLSQWSAKGGQAILDVLLLFLLAKETILGVNKPKNTIKNISKALEPIFLTKNQKS